MTLVEARSILHVGASYTVEELKSAYRLAAKKHHPDTGGSAEMFVCVRHAYDLLKSSPKGGSVWSKVVWSWDGSNMEQEQELLKLKAAAKILKMFYIEISTNGTSGFMVTKIHGIPIKLPLGVGYYSAFNKLKEIGGMYREE